jgi:DNA polymerase (family 10)
MDPLNDRIAARLEEVGSLLEQQGAGRFRVEAFRKGARTVRALPRPVSEILYKEGMNGLERLPGIGPVLARSIRSLVETGRLPMLERLRGASDPTALIATVAGIGPKLADRLHHDLHIGTLEDLETAAFDGRLARFEGIGPKRLAGVRDSLASRLGRTRAAGGPSLAEDLPPVADLLDVDREYREGVRSGKLPRIAPRRFNPKREAWLPILHVSHGDRHYTALYSNTARAHSLGRTRDWVVLYADGERGERPWTVVTESSGPLSGLRVVRGREQECLEHYGLAPRRGTAGAATA